MNTKPLSQIDLHFHAGLERQKNKTLPDYLQHACETGRRWQGVTDHYELYFRPEIVAFDGEEDFRLYPLGQAGMEALAAELSNLRARFPEMHLFFAPEYFTIYRPNGEHILPVQEAPGWLFALADYVIFDSGLYLIDNPQAKTEQLIEAMTAASGLRERFGKPVYMAHPLRCLVSDENSWRAPTPQIMALAEQAARTAEPALLNQLFEADLGALARAAAALGVPLEMNGMTQFRIRRAGPDFFQAYLAAYRLMAAEGARFVFGSDQHKISALDKSAGWWQPAETIGEECLDQAFFAALNID